MRFYSIFLSIILVFSLIGCSNAKRQSSNKETENGESSSISVTLEPVNIIPSTDFFAFSEWLDNEGFVPGMSQEDLMNKMETYSYNGQTVADAVTGIFHDGEYGGGYLAYAERFGFSNNYKESEDGKSAVSTNSFSTQVPLDALELPFEIEFDDTASDVMIKLGITTDHFSNFTADEGSDVVMTLYRDEQYTLLIRNLFYIDEPADFVAPCHIVFMENYVHTLKSGIIADVTRTITFAFETKDTELYEFSTEIKLKYDLSSRLP